MLRALHAEMWNKLVYPITGRMFAAVVDIRPEMDTFGHTVELTFDAVGAVGAVRPSRARQLDLCRRRRAGALPVPRRRLLRRQRHPGHRLGRPRPRHPVADPDPTLSQRDRENPRLRDLFPDKFATDDRRRHADRDASSRGGVRSASGTTARRLHGRARADRRPTHAADVDAAPLLRAHLRVPDERARLRAHRRAARDRGHGADRRPRGRRRRRPQHVLHPGERRQQALRPPRPAQGAEGPSAPTSRSRSAGAWPRRTAS